MDIQKTNIYPNLLEKWISNPYTLSNPKIEKLLLIINMTLFRGEGLC